MVSLLSCLTLIAQPGKTVQSVELTDANGQLVNLPYLGKKTFVLFYIDPDVEKISQPLSDAINRKKYPLDKFGAIGVVNCEDTWIPNAAIMSRVRQKQQEFPASLILLDESHELKTDWKPGECNDLMLVFVIGKDAKIKYQKSVKSLDESTAIISAVLKSIDSEMK